MYFSVPDDNPYTNRVKIPDNNGVKTCIDVRVNNGYVLGPGSVIDDREYTIIYDDPVSPLKDSPKLMKWVTPRPTVKRTREQITRSWSMDKYMVRREQQRLGKLIAEAIDGELNTKLYRASCDAGELVAAGCWDEADAQAFLEQAATESNLEPWRIGPTVASGLRRGEQNIEED